MKTGNASTRDKIMIRGIPVINNWNPQVNIITIVIPKSGCNNKRVDIINIEAIDQIQPGNFFFSTHNDKIHALKITKNGLHTSLG